MEIYKTYKGKDFIFHLFEENGGLRISLSSRYVYVPIDKKQLMELAKFIDCFIESGE